MLEPKFDPHCGLVLEGRLRLSMVNEAQPVGLFLAQGGLAGSAILVHVGGVTEFGSLQADGTGFKSEHRVDPEMRTGSTARFRLLLKGSLIEFYLNDLLIECYSLPQAASGRIGVIQGKAISHLKAWQCEATGTPLALPPLRQ